MLYIDVADRQLVRFCSGRCDMNRTEENASALLGLDFPAQILNFLLLVPVKWRRECLLSLLAILACFSHSSVAHVSLADRNPLFY